MHSFSLIFVLLFFHSSGTTAEDTRNPREIFLRSKSDSEAKPAKLPEKVPGDYTHKTESKSNHVTSGCKYFESISKLHTEYEEEYHEDRKHNKADRKLLEDNKEYYKVIYNSVLIIIR